MPNSIKFDMSLLHGQEPKNLVNAGGYFALSEDLKPELLPIKSLLVALPSNFGVYNISPLGLLSIVTNRRIEFIFADSPEDKGRKGENWWDADFCMVDFPSKPGEKLVSLWNGDQDVWENMIGILRGTPWFAAQFKEPQVLEAFFRSLWDEHYDHQESKMRVDYMQRTSAYKTAVHQLNRSKESIASLYQEHKLLDLAKSVIRAEVKKDRPGILVIPEDIPRLYTFPILRWIATVEKEEGLCEKNPANAVVIPQFDVKGKLVSWDVFPGQMLDDTGSYIEVPDMRHCFGLSNVYSKFGCTQGGTSTFPCISCPDTHTAFAVSVWMDEKRQGKKTNLEDLMK